MTRCLDIEDAEKHVQVCTNHALRYTLTRSMDGQGLLLAQEIMQEVRMLAEGMATDAGSRDKYIKRFLSFIERP